MAMASKFIEPRPFADPAVAAAKLLEIAQGLPDRMGRVCVGRWNNIFLAAGGNVDEYAAGRDHAIAAGLIEMHECGGFIMFTALGSASCPPQREISSSRDEPL
jgi:hypothetical protein